MRRYYLLADGVTITPDPPKSKPKACAKAANKKAAVKVFNASFEKVDGVYGERKKQPTPSRRVRLAPESVGGEPRKLVHPVRMGETTGANAPEADDDDLTELRDDLAARLDMGRLISSTFHYQSVSFTVPPGTAVTLSTEGAIHLAYTASEQDTEGELPLDAIMDQQ